VHTGGTCTLGGHLLIVIQYNWDKFLGGSEEVDLCNSNASSSILIEHMVVGILRVEVQSKKVVDACILEGRVHWGDTYIDAVYKCCTRASFSCHITAIWPAITE
jgi:hypothetical protein